MTDAVEIVGFPTWKGERIDIPDSLPHTRDAVLDASDEDIFDLMSLCDAEDGPGHCVACYAYQVMQERAESPKQTVATSVQLELAMDVVRAVHEYQSRISSDDESLDWVRDALDALSSKTGLPYQAKTGLDDDGRK